MPLRPQGIGNTPAGDAFSRIGQHDGGAIPAAPARNSGWHTSTGKELSVVVPFPSWPEVFAPQHCTVESDRTAQLCPAPAVSDDGGSVAEAGLVA
jgi:hypothetical protein